MGETFKAITTQEELNQVISERINRAKEKAVEPYADYDDLKKSNDDLKKSKQDLEAQVKKLNDSLESAGKQKEQIAELTGKVKQYEKEIMRSKVAREANLPYDLADRLRGENEDDMRKDAESLSELLKNNKTVIPPLKDTESNLESTKDAAMQSLLKGLKGE